MGTVEHAETRIAILMLPEGVQGERSTAPYGSFAQHVFEFEFRNKSSCELADCARR